MSNAEVPWHRCISPLGERQGGFVRRKQLIAEGLGRGRIEWWLRTGHLIPAWPGVYAVGHMPTEPRARAFGAMLAAGDHAAIARWSAGAFYGAIKRWPDPYELVAPRRVEVSGLAVHVSTTLLLRDVWRFDGLRVTSPARTALDLAADTTPERLKRIVEHLRLRHSLSLEQLVDVISRNRRHPGVVPLRMLIGLAGRRATRSELERRLWPAFARAFDIPPYEQNVMVGGFEVDVLVDGLLIVELDTFETHLLNFDSDRERDAEILARTGLPTIRLTDRQLASKSEKAAAQILAVVERQRQLTRRN